MVVSSRDLAEALAARLDEIVPEGLDVKADDGQVVVRRGESVLGGSAAPQILDGDSDVRHLETAARSTINAVQDVVAEDLATPWPARSGAMPEVEVRVEDGVLLAWFGPPAQPVIALAPFAFAQ